MADAIQQPRRAKLWVLMVFALGLPSVAFVVCHVLLERLKDQMPKASAYQTLFNVRTSVRKSVL
jgi:hypothetical protein